MDKIYLNRRYAERKPAKRRMIGKKCVVKANVSPNQENMLKKSSILGNCHNEGELLLPKLEWAHVENWPNIFTSP